jgi:ADP-heptose:LPS heptosyltransferase
VQVKGGYAMKNINEDKVLIFQPWGIGDILMAVPAAKKLVRYGFRVDLISTQKNISQFLLTQNIFDTFFYVNWTKYKIINTITLIYLCLTHFRKYEFLLIPDGLNAILINILNIMCAGKVNTIFNLNKEKISQSRIKNNIAIAESIVLKKETICENIARDCSNYEFQTRVKKSKKNKIAIFMGASESFKAPPAEAVILACDILQAEGYSISEFTDGLSYVVAPKRTYIQKIPFLPFDELYKLMLDIDILIVGDTGLAHFASLCGVTIIMLAGPTKYMSTSPTGALIVLSDKALPCRPCYGTRNYGCCPIAVECMHSITPQNILNKVKSVLTF